MKNPNLFRAIATLMIAGLVVTPGMTQTTAQERAANLRQQLVEAQAKQAELETRLQQLEEDLKPENIEKRLAGIGSTRPEELREQQRRQLEIEQKSVQRGLDQLATTRTRLETAIVQADAAAYHSSASVNAGGTEKETTAKEPTSAQSAAVTQPTVTRRARRGSRDKPRPKRTRRRS